MKLEVKYWGQIKQAAGVATQSIELPAGATVLSLISHLAELYGEPLKTHLIDSNGKPRSSLLVVMGDQQIDVGIDPPLSEGDSITLLPPIAGGHDG